MVVERCALLHPEGNMQESCTSVAAFSAQPFWLQQKENGGWSANPWFGGPVLLTLQS